MPTVVRRNTLSAPVDIPLSVKEFDLLKDLVYAHFGINLEGKESLFKTRVQRVLREGGYDSYQAYYDFLIANPDGFAWIDLSDAISTNYTYFYREKEHYEFLGGTVIPEVVARLKKIGSSDLRVWCAACSTGEEAYEIAMTMREALGSDSAKWWSGLLATDISTKALRRAAQGEYTEKALGALPGSFRIKYFYRKAGGKWQINDALKKALIFRKFNLMTKRFPFKKPFQIVFCRNVMIYFDDATNAGLLERIYQAMAPQGYLFMSHTESLGRSHSRFLYVAPGVYRRK